MINSYNLTIFVIYFKWKGVNLSNKRIPVIQDKISQRITSAIYSSKKTPNLLSKRHFDQYGV